MKQADPDVVRKLNKKFASKSRKEQIQEIQKLLYSYNLGPVVNPVDGRTSYQIPLDGKLSPLTQAYIDAYRKQYSSKIASSNLATLYSGLIENGPFPSVNPIRQASDINTAPKEQSIATGQISVGRALNLQTAVIYRVGGSGSGEILLVAGGRLRSGDQYKIVVQPDQDCYLYVFQRDSAGRFVSPVSKK